jgi:lysophospholipase L1-like esterase
MSMVELAKANGIRVVLASVLPAIDFPWRPEHPNPSEKIIALNRWIKDYAANNGLVYLDYYTAMVDERGGLKKEYAADAVHPNRAGYAVMAPLAEKAIAEALAGK